ncbi:Protein jagged-1b [Schistosoma japonicum]|uniref:Delta-like protein n=2 Tax=Schistosoma japonicum TaxID=6182 RepID=A0A4Z2DN50_SCHJA|nr:Protein jagged-1b [Schistosoma japonicum]
MQTISVNSSYLLIILLHGFIYIGLFCNPVQSQGQPYGGAQLKIEWDYNNPDSLLENGQICDRVGGKECDVYFTLCLKNAASVTNDIEKCHLLQHTTRVFDNAGYLEFREGDGIEIFVPQPVPNEYTFTLGIFEQDIFGSVEVIGTLVAEKFYLLPTNNWTDIRMFRENDQYKNRIYVNVRMQLSCLKYYYGNHCHVFCKPEPSRYTCSSDGSYICLPGLRGPKCDKEDSCYFEPCADHALCINKDDETGRICICNGEERPECYLDYNPCDSTPCQNGGECQLTGHYNKSFVCHCTEQWTGHKCTERRSACLEEAEKIRRNNINVSDDYYSNSTEVTSVCLNGGTCFEHPIRFEVRCVCLPGWIGNRCEIPVELEEQKSNWILITLIGVGVVLFFIVVALTIGVVWKYVLKKRKSQHHDKHGAIVLYHNPQNLGQSNFGSSCPLNQHFMNITYEDTSALPPIITKSSSAAYSKKLEPSPIPDEYDECDPLGIYAGTEIYETSFPPDENVGFDNKNNLSSTAETEAEPFDEDAPPLPNRPTTYDSSPIIMDYDFNQLIDKQRPLSNVSTFTNNFNDSLTYQSNL